MRASLIELLIYGAIASVVWPGTAFLSSLTYPVGKGNNLG
jgi:hypothetical protein